MGARPAAELVPRGLKRAPLSFAQERLWLIDAAAPGSATYNVPLLLRWRDRVDVGALRAALDALVRRHEILRTTYRLDGGELRQSVQEEAAAQLRVLTGVPSDEDLAREARSPFALDAQPPIRAVLWQSRDGDQLLITVHHIAIDGWSLAPFFTDLARAYRRARRGEDPTLPAAPIQYSDFACWEREGTGFDPDDVKMRLDELRPFLADVPLGEPQSGSRSAAGDRPGGYETFVLPAPLWRSTAELARTLRATPFAVLLAALEVVVSRWSGLHDFVIGTMTANRPHPAVDDMVGFFVNTVPLTCSLDTAATFAELCKTARREAYSALRHQRLPFEQLVAEASRQRLHTDGPMVGIGFVLQNSPTSDLGEDQPWERPELLPTGTAKFDLSLVLEEDGDRLAGFVEFARDRYDSATARAVAEQFMTVLEAAVADPETPVAALRLSGGEPCNTLHGHTGDLVERSRREWREAA